MDDATHEFSEDEAADPAVARAERRLAILAELADIGMSLARRLTYGAADRLCDKDWTNGDPGDAFARISRAVRLTVALEEKTERYLSDLKAGVLREREEKRVKAADRAREVAEKASEERQEKASRLVLDVAESESESEDEFEGLVQALLERMDLDPTYESCGQWPLREIVERLCNDLDLHPDWSHWTGEGWDEHYSGLNLFSKPSRRPVVWAYEPAVAEAAAADNRRLE